MRIRKNAKLSSLLRSHASPPEPPLPSHVCLLNQSPWDVLPFSFPDALPPSSSSLHQQLDGGEDSFTANGSSFGDSLGAVESSVASMMAVDAEDKTVIVSKLEGRAYNRMNIEDRMNISSYEAKNEGDFSFKVCCNKTDGKRWQCKKDAVDGHYLCAHHLSQLKSYITTAAAAAADDDDEGSNAANADDSASRRLDKSSASTGRRGRPRGAKKNSSSSSAAAAANSNQFYYYSGFGPSWGKRRSSGRAGDQPRRPEGRAGGSPQPTPPRIGGEGIDYVDYDMDDDDDDDEEEEDDDDEDDDGDSGKKRMRKPVKARSLKSLM